MKVIITGATGMVGKAALLECLEHPEIESVLVLNRNTIGFEHPKMIEVLNNDFSEFNSIKESFEGYDACFYCLGVSAAGLNETQYRHITFDFTKALAQTLYGLNSQMVFVYVSGMGTDSSEKGKIMWARIKGETENMILNMGFRDAYAFRPGFILPEKGVRSRTRLYNVFYKITWPLFPLLRKLKSVTTSSKVGKAMIYCAFHQQGLKHLENKEINRLVADLGN